MDSTSGSAWIDLFWGFLGGRSHPINYLFFSVLLALFCWLDLEFVCRVCSGLVDVFPRCLVGFEFTARVEDTLTLSLLNIYATVQPRTIQSYYYPSIARIQGRHALDTDTQTCRTGQWLAIDPKRSLSPYVDLYVGSLFI